VGLGETLLRFGERERALHLFGRVAEMGFDDDIELMLTIGRALYREAMYSQCRDVFAKAAAARPDSAEAAASLGYALHRLGDDVGAGRQIRRALRLDADLHEARIYLGHLLYDRGDWEGALREFERVAPQEHWDPLAVWRLMELKRALWHVESGDARLAPWEQRLRDLEQAEDSIDRLLSEVERSMGGDTPTQPPDPSQLELFERDQTRGKDSPGAVRLSDGHLFRGSWHDIVRQMRDRAGFSHETLGDYMRRLAERWHEESGVEIPFTDPETFLRTAIALGLARLEVDGEPGEGEPRR
jgi:tetratricopeptide (TPR) repeat protein